MLHFGEVEQKIGTISTKLTLKFYTFCSDIGAFGGGGACGIINYTYFK